MDCQLDCELDSTTLAGTYISYNTSGHKQKISACGFWVFLHLDIFKNINSPGTHKDSGMNRDALCQNFKV